MEGKENEGLENRYKKIAKLECTVYLYVLGIAAVAVALFVSHQNILTLFLGAFMYFFGALGTRYAYNFRKFGNRWHDTFNRRERDDDEPSDFAIKVTRVAGYVLTLIAICLMMFV